MPYFDDLPAPESVWRQNAATLSTWQRFLIEAATPFSEIAEHLRDHIQPVVVVVSQQEVTDRHWFFGASTRIVQDTRQGWEIGWIEPNSDFPTKAYLLVDGSVYPNTEAGIRSLFPGTFPLAPGGSLSPGAVERLGIPAALRELADRLKEKYVKVWCPQLE
jgi:hypothetical protein